MKPKKIKKLVLKKEIISNLTENQMSSINGGGTDGSGYGPCACNPTAYCNGASFPYGNRCGADTSYIACYCA